MSSGFGLKGGVGRCYNNWVDFLQCTKDEQKGLVTLAECRLPRNDYLECLKHHKEKARLYEIRDEILKEKDGKSSRLPVRGIISINEI
ncbi:uncharacterized protein V2V93DRAFT_367122 [Kockiozyma suomiensis]|uniref:uncharacterized protein n=1 Tax=Kockiozyma suomiensis TaxID=1337062 RepID=UPI003342FB7F